MGILIGVQEISKVYSERVLFEKLSFAIETGERIGLIGPNGAGKSTLLSILAGITPPDSGRLSVQRGLKVALLEQVPKLNPDLIVQEAVLEGTDGEWEDIARAQEWIAKLSLADYAETKVGELSGGWQKRVALARELRKQPDLLLLDEPTNHFDVESILWLEEFLANAPFATLTITHDRVFLQKVSNRILELNRRYPAGVLSVSGDYVKYLETKDALLTAQASQEVKLRNTLRRETEWLRQGAKARTTKQQARIQRAEALGDTVAGISSRNAETATRFDFKGFERNPKRLLEAKGISLAYDGRQIIPPLDLLLTPKSRLGLIGANGCGKSSLIRVLLGHEKPDTGEVLRAENLQVNYFEQNRESLDPELTVLRTVCPVGEYLHYAGSEVHVRTYLDRFLFSGKHVEMPVKRLSGGEQSRLLLARLMLRECNLLVLDEPTNDLDMTTLDLLQDVLQEFNGAVLLVTHDRFFLDQVANQILGFGRGKKGEAEIVPFANVAQWETWFEQKREEAQALARSSENKKESAAAAASKRKLSFKEQRELDGIEGTIEKAELRLTELTNESSLPEVTTNASRLLKITEEMSALQKEIERLYARWQELTK